MRERRVRIFVVKFSRQPTEETLDGRSRGETTGNRQKEEEGNVEEILRADAEQDSGRGRAGPGRVRADHRVGINRMHRFVERTRDSGWQRVLDNRRFVVK